MKTFKEQTGWTGLHPLALCQDFDTLTRVREYSFDLRDWGFLAYAEQRGVLYKAGENARYRFTGDHAATKARFFEEFALAIPQPDGTRYRFTPHEMETHWKIMLAAKGQLQQCWDLYHDPRTRFTAAAASIDTRSLAQSTPSVNMGHLGE